MLLWQQQNQDFFENMQEKKSKESRCILHKVFWMLFALSEVTWVACSSLICFAGRQALCYFGIKMAWMFNSKHWGPHLMCYRAEFDRQDNILWYRKDPEKNVLQWSVMKCWLKHWKFCLGYVREHTEFEGLLRWLMPRSNLKFCMFSITESNCVIHGPKGAQWDNKKTSDFDLRMFKVSDAGTGALDRKQYLLPLRSVTPVSIVPFPSAVVVPVSYFCRVRKGTGSQSVAVCVAKYPEGESWQRVL